jgi:hypothetical protein
VACFPSLTGSLNLLSGPYHRTSYSPWEISFLMLSDLHYYSYSQTVLMVPPHIRNFYFFFNQIEERAILLDINKLITIPLYIKKNQLVIITLSHVN